MDIKYIAGFVDGEGHFGSSVRRDSPRGRSWRFVVVNTHRPIIKALHGLLGGKVYEVKPSSPAHRHQWRLVITGRKRVRSVMLKLRPHLFVKRAEVEKLLRICVPVVRPKRFCRFVRCKRKYLAKGMCSLHYQREKAGAHGIQTHNPDGQCGLRGYPRNSANPCSRRCSGG